MEFDFGNRCYIMGILNVTPDSFSDGGRFVNIDRAVGHAVEMEKEGASIIDVGGESTRPGHTEVSVQEELDRVIPVIERLKSAVGIPVSVDTSKAEVAEAAVRAGASMINDVWGFRKDPDMAVVAAGAGVPCCLMHNRKKPEYSDVVAEVISDLSVSTGIAIEAGVDRDKIIIDPGIGFGKTLEHNLVIMKNIKEFSSLGFPVLLGTSRKSMIGLTLDLPVDQRIEGTIATTVLGVMGGMSVFRVHDVAANLRAVRMTEAILKAGYGNEG